MALFGFFVLNLLNVKITLTMIKNIYIFDC